MIYLLLVASVLMLLAGAIGITVTRKWSDDDMNGHCWLFVFGLFLTIIFAVLISSCIIANGKGLMKWQAFYEANSRNYEIAVDETASYLSADQYIEHALIPIEGSIERFKLTEVISTRIMEWRDAVNKYNLTIASMKYFDSNPFTGVLVPDAVQDMKLLVIK